MWKRFSFRDSSPFSSLPSSSVIAQWQWSCKIYEKIDPLFNVKKEKKERKKEKKIIVIKG